MTQRQRTRQRVRQNGSTVTVTALILLAIVMVTLLITTAVVVTRPVHARCEITGWKEIPGGVKLGGEFAPNLNMVPTGMCDVSGSVLLFNMK